MKGTAPAISAATAPAARHLPVLQPIRCQINDWCVRAPGHTFGCTSAILSIDSSSTGDRPIPHQVLQAQLSYDDEIGLTKLVFDAGGDDWVTYDSGDELRAYLAKVRQHLTRLDAIADQYDATIATEAAHHYPGRTA
ncbi:hypothetical protein [Streptomyces sp. RPT161]|uniref:hypothetical protein n=1 Tax=Streptomyces sp. RPT161 TaxID=3015993 RepID=UPI0022B91ABA|nr:hypothetical protein [Streptomyces sp. RPT161]